jgi:multidrug efflux pump subunit AcrA (membrane-fusion protein)
MSSDAHAAMAVQADAADAARVQVGNPAQVRLDSVPDRSFAAQVVSVTSGSAGTDEGKSLITAQLTDAPPQLSYGQTGHLTITTASSSHALVVPQSAIVTKDGQPHVLRLSGSHDDLVPVMTGMTAHGQTEIISGLAADDRVRATVNVY